MTEQLRRQNKQNKKNFKLIFILIGALLLAIAGGLLAYHSKTKNEQKQRVALVKEFTQFLSQGKYDSLPKIFLADTAQRNGYSDKEITAKYQNIFTAIEVKNIKMDKLKIVKQKEDKYQVSYELSFSTAMGQLKNLKYQTYLAYEEGKPKLEWGPNLIFPQMSGKDKVSMTVDEPIRGKILDRNNQPLAENGPLQQLGVVPQELGEGDKKEKNIKAIAETYDLTEKQIIQAVEQSWVKPNYFVPLKIVDEVKGLPTGASIQEITGRKYPLGAAAAHLVGYLGKITADDLKKHPELTSEGEIGRAGLEAVYDEKLRGKAGGKLAITDEKGNEKNVLLETKKQDGTAIQVTIDSSLQELAYNALAKKRGATVVSAPHNGELLALVSSPSYDPNKMTNGISQKDYDTYEKDEKKPFLNRFLTGYAPGSTFKAITAAIGLDNASLNPNEKLAIKGLKWQQDTSWGNYYVTRVADVGQVDLKAALVYSDNIYMAQETLKMGEKAFRAGLNKFIFGEKLNVPLAMNPAQISNEESFNSSILLADTGYGQGQLLINPIQQATMYSVFANKGTLVYPKLLTDVKVSKKADVVKETSVDRINEDLKAVVSDPNGTAHSLNSLGYPLAAKTGTAEIKEKQDERGQQNSFLLAYEGENSGYLFISMLEDRQENESATQLAPNVLAYLHEHY
ncbi:penicillin-binding protein 4 [Enterococcus saigonensis]|uniref:Penicillin-binding protein 4 n=1 Tax=Enterococcus saigonensis TaxID=1805431 RepID=A0A679IIB3_9ENTE|nr:penicillin-binding transpeptidase domain-containing protein [Enterococcus saigonensis]BCA84846.1 penicillin-binding protein 4 [Enterococcus saigonensis]